MSLQVRIHKLRNVPLGIKYTLRPTSAAWFQHRLVGERAGPGCFIAESEVLARPTTGLAGKKSPSIWDNTIAILGVVVVLTMLVAAQVLPVAVHEEPAPVPRIGGLAKVARFCSSTVRHLAPTGAFISLGALGNFDLFLVSGAAALAPGL